jgi:DNA-binding CsgD family transcriptional regulator
VRLLGRGDEQRVLERMLNAARAGSSGALVLRGDPGIGKTSLLHHATQLAPDFETVTVAGAEERVGDGFVDVQRFLQPLSDRLGELRSPNIDAARSAFGLDSGPLADRFVVGLALLDVLASLSETRPILCVIDDAQWLHPESLDSFALVARRAHTERLVVLFGARDPGPDIAGVPDLRLRGLSERSGLELVRQSVRAAITDAAARRVVAETDGSPLGIIELAHHHSTSQLEVRAGDPEPLPITRRLEEHFVRNVRELPDATQTLLLLAAADTSGRPEIVREAALHLGVDAAAADPARAADVLDAGSDTAFRHPLIRSATYAAASAPQRRRAHAALAHALALHGDTDRCVWHLAASTTTPNRESARLLEAAARRAGERGAHGTAAAFWRRGGQLSVDAGERCRRLLAAVDAHLDAGAPGRALALLDEVEDEFTDPFQRGRWLLLSGIARYVLGHADGTTSILMAAATALREHDLDLARDAMRYALTSARIAGRLAQPGETYWDVIAFSETFPLPSRREPLIPDRLVDGQAALWRDHGRAVALLRPCLDALAADDDMTPNGLLWIAFGCWSAGAIADDGRMRTLAARLVDHGRRRQAPEAISRGLLWLGLAELLAGSLLDARRHFAERATILDAVGHRVADDVDVFDALVAAWEGDDERTRSAAEVIERAALVRSHGWVLPFLEYSLAVLELGRSNYAAAFRTAMTDFREHPVVAIMSLPERIEAGVRCGEGSAAHDALDQLSGIALASGTPLALGLLERCRALVADDEAATHYDASLRHLRSCGEVQLARTQLVYGEWLRRRRRRSDAREQLRCAHATFDAVGAHAFRERAAIELAATGAHARRHHDTEVDSLTPQERQVADLAATGATNAEIAASLFISASTVDYHLGKIYRKLAIGSRRDLASRLPTRS